jgi:hypothetical protein
VTSSDLERAFERSVDEFAFRLVSISIYGNFHKNVTDCPSRRFRIKRVVETEPTSCISRKEVRRFARGVFPDCVRCREVEIFLPTRALSSCGPSTSVSDSKSPGKSARTPQRASASLARAPQGRSARNADAVEASGSPRERARGTSAGGRAGPERAAHRVACDGRPSSARVRLRAATRGEC